MGESACLHNANSTLSLPLCNLHSDATCTESCKARAFCTSRPFSQDSRDELGESVRLCDTHGSFLCPGNVYIDAHCIESCGAAAPWTRLPCLLTLGVAAGSNSVEHPLRTAQITPFHLLRRELLTMNVTRH